MYKIEYANNFKKDLKLMQKRNAPMSEIKLVIKILASENKIPVAYRNHKLKGNLFNKWDLHIQPDWILLYKNKVIKLVRAGTHADIFK